jgi:hypothetical protein
MAITLTGTRASNTDVLTPDFAGAVIQVKQTIDTAISTITNTGTASTFVDCGSLSVAITPSDSNNKILICAEVNVTSNTADRFAFFKFEGGNTASGVGDSANNRQRILKSVYFPATSSQTPVSMCYLDSPATASAITYKVKIAPNFTNGNLLINSYAHNDADEAYIPRTANTITVMEIVV